VSREEYRRNDRNNNDEYQDFYENVKFQTIKSRKKPLEPRGVLANYLSINSEETLFDNTLTGFLISHFLKGGKSAEKGFT